MLKRGPDFLDSVSATGKVFMITGANSGVGMEVALFLAKKGATVHMVCRSAKRGAEARQSIIEQSSNSQVVLHVCDCGLEADVRSMWSAFAQTNTRLDGLVCNAGVLLNELTLTPEGVETTFACHLLFGTYLLGSLAMSLLEATAGSRVVAVSSGGMYNTKFPEWGVATAEKGTYSGNLAYAYAKRGQVLLCERWSLAHPSVRFVSTHPGWTATPAVDAAYGDQKKYLEPMRTPWEGAEGIAWLCVALPEELVQGAFYLDRKVEPKHIAGPFFTEGSFTKNTPLEVDGMMAKLETWANGRRGETTAEEQGAAARKSALKESSAPIDIERFMGRWYVVAGIPTPLDRGAINSIEEYTWNAAKQHIDVSFRMQASPSAAQKEYIQRATISNAGTNTRWSITPRLAGVFLPVGFAYLVVDCDADYSSTIIGTPDRSILYVMTRTPHPDEAVVERLLDTCKRTGHDMSKVERITHEYAADGTTAAVQPQRMDVPRTLPGKPFDGPPRLCLATMSPSHNGGNAKRVLDAITAASSSSGKYATWFALFPRGASSPYYQWVEELKAELPDEQREQYASRRGWSAPFVWLELPDGTRRAIGGRDALCAWALAEFADVPAVVAAASAPLRYTDALASVAKPANATPPRYLDKVAPTPSQDEVTTAE